MNILAGLSFPTKVINTCSLLGKFDTKDVAMNILAGPSFPTNYYFCWETWVSQYVHTHILEVATFNKVLTDSKEFSDFLAFLMYGQIAY